MNMRENEEYCSNCERNVAAANYITHSLHCKRYIELCSHCNEPVPAKEMKEHLNLMHCIVACSKCLNAMEKWILNDHEVVCIKNLTPCDYCKLEVPADRLQEHRSFCGSRTEACIYCKKFVLLKDKDSHVKKCMDSHVKKCIYRSNMIGNTQLDTNTIKSTRKSENYFRQHETAHKIIQETCEGFIRKNLAPCEYCELEVPADELQKHLSFCGSRTEPCVYCKKLVLLKEKNCHLVKCLYRFKMMNNTPHTMYSETMKSTSDSKNYFRQHENVHVVAQETCEREETCVNTGEKGRKTKSKFPYDVKNIKGELVLLPCEFCTKLCHADELIMHQTGCRPELCMISMLSDVQMTEKGRLCQKTLNTDNYPVQKVQISHLNMEEEPSRISYITKAANRYKSVEENPRAKTKSDSKNPNENYLLKTCCYKCLISHAKTHGEQSEMESFDISENFANNCHKINCNIKQTEAAASSVEGTQPQNQSKTIENRGNSQKCHFSPGTCDTRGENIYGARSKNPYHRKFNANIPIHTDFKKSGMSERDFSNKSVTKSYCSTSYENSKVKVKNQKCENKAEGNLNKYCQERKNGRCQLKSFYNQNENKTRP